MLKSSVDFGNVDPYLNFRGSSVTKQVVMSRCQKFDDQIEG